MTFSFTSESHRLAGTLVRPAGSSSAALLISGSGPIDRDSNMKRMKIGVMAQVAARLEADGIASLRYDRRGVGESEGNYRSTGFYDNVADAAAGVAALRAQDGIEHILVIGHSEGALIAGELAAADPRIEGVVLLAGAATNGEDILLWQMGNVGDSIPKPVQWILKVLRMDLVKTQRKSLNKIKESTMDVMRIQMVRINAKWFREFMAHDPSVALRGVDVPVLAITGAKDIQVNPADIARMGELVGDGFTGVVPDNLTHLLRLDEGPASVRTYKKQMRRPVAAAVLDRVAEWVTARTAVTNRSST